jgi:membrane protein
LAKKGVGLYFHYFQTYSVVYGALAALPFLMIWIYVVWVIFFLGSHVVNVLRQYKTLKEKFKPLISLL